MQIHELKTWPEPFEAVWSGLKNFEVRISDRNFAVGDVLLLREYDAEAERYTGRQVSKTLTYIVFGGQWGLPPNLCVLGWAMGVNSGEATTEGHQIKPKG